MHEPNAMAKEDKIASELKHLNDSVYELVLYMNTHLREGQVGRGAIEPLLPSTLSVQVDSTESHPPS
jgi:hypothetical protein